jgi:hypothetical protein
MFHCVQRILGLARSWNVVSKKYLRRGGSINLISLLLLGRTIYQAKRYCDPPKSTRFTEDSTGIAEPFMRDMLHFVVASVSGASMFGQCGFSPLRFVEGVLLQAQQRRNRCASAPYHVL